MQVRAFLDITFLKMIVKANITANSELFDFLKKYLEQFRRYMYYKHYTVLQCSFVHYST